MLTTAIVFFVLAIALGLYLLTYVLQSKNTPKGVVFTHGPLAATGLIILIVYAFFHRHHFPMLSIILFALAAVGGFAMVFQDISGKQVPKAMALGHGLTAILAFIFLIMFLYS